MTRIVLDTNVFVGACLGAGASNQIVGACLENRLVAIMGNALFAEYEDVLSRDALFAKSRLNRKEREELFDIFCAHCEWIRVYYQWRPNLKDEADNHLIELAVAGNAECIVTRNTKDIAVGQLAFPHIKILTPEAFLKEHSL
jgi:putative PIN family toxin of toxin-antitoxin system